MNEDDSAKLAHLVAMLPNRWRERYDH